MDRGTPDLRITSSRGGGLEALGLEADQAVGLTIERSFAEVVLGDTAVAAHRRALGGQHIELRVELAGRTYATLLGNRSATSAGPSPAWWAWPTT